MKLIQIIAVGMLLLIFRPAGGESGIVALRVSGCDYYVIPLALLSPNCIATTTHIAET